jgi:Uma2 family endonuclease
MFAVAGDFRRVGGILAILAAIFLAFLNRTIASRMRAHTFSFFGHDVLLPASDQQFRYQMHGNKYLGRDAIMITMATVTAPLTIEQFLQLPEEETQRCELVEGEIVPMGNAGRGHELVKSNFIRHLVAYDLQHCIGRIFSETMYAIRTNEGRQPDVSFLLSRRLTPGDPAKPFEGSPDLAVEVVSSETADFLERKISLYLETGSHAVWVAYPRHRTLWTHHGDGIAKVLKEDQYLEEPELLPGFRILVSQFFEGI